MPTGLAPRFFTQAAQARAARAVIEWALDGSGWPYSRRLSLLLDLWLILDEGDA
jgi:hypothetical protein